MKRKAFWIVTALFCLQMTFTAYAQLRLPQVAAAFAHLGFPNYFRVELSLAKLVGVVLLLVSCDISCGMYSKEDAKITGITPAWLTFSGR